MTNQFKSYFRRVAEGYEKGPTTKYVTPILDTAAGVYEKVSKKMKAMYKQKKLTSTKLPFPVVSVGNLTWGGTGKTPLVEYLARKIAERSKTPLILTRGYSQDEVVQFRHHVPKAVIGVGKNRAEVAQKIAKEKQIDMAILDDGFQHWKVQRDLEVVTINALNPFGNGKLIPRGILREPVEALDRADIVVISHSNLIAEEPLEELKGQIAKVAPKAKIVETFLEPLFFYRAQTRDRVMINRLKNQKVTTFAGVGSPKSFQMMLSRERIKPARNFEFTDHHNFTEKELLEIQKVSESAGAQEVVTTEKDFYRSAKLITQTLNPLVLATRIRVSQGEDFLNEEVNKLLGVRNFEKNRR